MADVDCTFTGATLHPGFTYKTDGKLFSYDRIYSGTVTGSLEGSFRMREDMVLDESSRIGSHEGTILIHLSDGREIFGTFKGMISPNESGTLSLTGRWSVLKASRKQGLIEGEGNGEYAGPTSRSGFFKISVTGKIIIAT